MPFIFLVAFYLTNCMMYPCPLSFYFSGTMKFRYIEDKQNNIPNNVTLMLKECK